MTDWTAYLDSVCEEYSRWWDDFTATDVERSLLDLEVERIEEARSPSEREKKVERLGVLAGLRKYAKERVLLVGVPGSGKSTALRRLVLEVAQEVRERGGDRIPVLVELRYGEDSLFELILDSFWRHDPGLDLDEKVLKQGLRQGRFWLLLDGLNELPSRELRSQLRHLTRHYPRTWMVVTTRDLGSGGLLAVEKQLTMQPLTEEQMRTFIRKQQQGEQILQQLGSRLRELGKTPMFLWMLCETVRVRGEMPRGLGELLHGFVRRKYEGELKTDVPADELRRWWQDLLEELAFAMMQGKERTDLRLVVSRKEAEEIWVGFLAQKGERDRLGRVKVWLEGLLAHHLLQVGGEDRLVFHHQLIQEYYAAMRLRRMVSGLTDEVLQRDYLNLVKWTEAIALMLGLLEDEEQAVRVVRLALAVDWQLGARLAGEVKRELQGKTVALVSELDVPLKVKYELWGMTRSNEVVDYLISALQDEDSSVRSKAAEALGKIGSEAGVEPLISALQDEHFQVCRNITIALEKIGWKWVETPLVSALQDQSSKVRRGAVKALGKIGLERAINPLISALQDKDSEVRENSISALGEIGLERAIDPLIVTLQDEDPNVRRSTVIALGQIGLEQSVDSLIFALQDEHYLVRWGAAIALEAISSERAIEPLVFALQDEYSLVRWSAAVALRTIESECTVSFLISDLQDEDSMVRWKVIEALAIIDSKWSVLLLTCALRDKDSEVRKKVVEALKATDIGNIEWVMKLVIFPFHDEDPELYEKAVKLLREMDSEETIEFLLSTIKEDEKHCSLEIKEQSDINSEQVMESFIFTLQDRNAEINITAEILEALGLEEMMRILIFALQDEDLEVAKRAKEILELIDLEKSEDLLMSILNTGDSRERIGAAEALDWIGSERVVEPLISALKDDNIYVQSQAIKALGRIASNQALEALILVLRDESLYIRWNALEALKNIAQPIHIPQFLLILYNIQDFFILETIAAIQARAKYYNHALTLPTSTPDPQERAKLENIPPSPYPTLPMSETPRSLHFPNAQNVNVNYISGHGGNHTYHFAPTQDLETTIAEIKKQLQELQEKNPNATEAEILQEAIQNNSTLKDRLLNALKRGGLETLKTFIPGFSIAQETFLGLLQNDSDREVRQIATEAIAQLQEQNTDKEE